MKKGIGKILNTVKDEVDKDISAFARSGDNYGNGLYARGLASEGYNGGYRDALADVMLAMRGIFPGNRGRDWWDKVKGEFDS